MKRLCEDFTDKETQANRLEGRNAATRRRNSAYRRRTNTYAKNLCGLQRTLDMNWVFENFSRPHFTTKIVPVFTLGILNVGLQLCELLKLPILTLA
ncbi:MAG: hypothetical protein KA436_08765 [Oligoflexales bacterium]|nr:hypothetical protein [Oligoflexales bacterium]